MQYAYTPRVKHRYRKIPATSILCGNKKAVVNLLDAITSYTGKTKTEVIYMLQNIELGNWEDFEKFIRIVNYSLADFLNEINRKIVKKRIIFLKNGNIEPISIIEKEFTVKFCQFLQEDNALKEIIIKYLRLLILNMARSQSLEKRRISRQLKKIRSALIINDWGNFLQVSSVINEIENEGYQILR